MASPGNGTGPHKATVRKHAALRRHLSLSNSLQDSSETEPPILLRNGTDRSGPNTNSPSGKRDNNRRQETKTRRGKSAASQNSATEAASRNHSSSQGQSRSSGAPTSAAASILDFSEPDVELVHRRSTLTLSERPTHSHTSNEPDTISPPTTPNSAASVNGNASNALAHVERRRTASTSRDLGNRRPSRLRTRSFAAITIHEDAELAERVNAPPFEDILLQLLSRLREEALLADLITATENDFQLVRIPRQRRTEEPPLNEKAIAAVRDLFARQCLAFYASKWHVVRPTSRTKSQGTSESVHRISEPLPQLISEVDLDDTQAQGLVSLLLPYPGLTPTNSNSNSRLKTIHQNMGMSTTNCNLTKQCNGDSAANLIQTKVRKRYLVFRYQTKQGPPVLEVFKSEQLTGSSDTVPLADPDTLSMEGDTGFRVQTANWAYLFHLENADACQHWFDTMSQKLAEWRRIDVIKAESTDKPKPLQQTKMPLAEVLKRAMRTLDGTLFSATTSKKCDEARSDLMAVYHRADAEAATTSPEAVPFMKENFGRRFVVTCNSLHFDLAVTVGGATTNPEPYFCALYLVNLDDHDDGDGLLSERFWFQLNKSTMGYCHLDLSKTSLENQARQAVFSVHQSAKRVFLVLTIETALQAENPVVAYTKKQNADRYAQAAAEALQKQPEARMPMAWACRPVFKANGDLDEASAFSPLFRYDTDTMTAHGMRRAVTEYEDKAIMRSARSKLRWTELPGAFEASVNSLEATSDMPTVTPSLHHVKPFNHEQTVPPRREVMTFSYTPVQAPHLDCINILYVYPVSINLSTRKLDVKSKGQNILCTVQLMETDANGLDSGTTGTPCVFGRHLESNFTTEGRTPVLWHNKAPVFTGEIKIQLPPHITTLQHVLFTFSHVAVRSRRRKATQALGYAFLPLSPSARLFNNQQDLFVASANTQYPNQKILPPHYATSGMSIDASSAQNVKFLDPTTPQFSVATRLVSTISTADRILSQFFECAEQVVRTALIQTDLKLKAATQALVGAGDEALFRFQPVIFNQLLSLLVHGSSDETVPREAVRTLVILVDKFHTDMHTPLPSNEHKNQVLASYVEHVFAIKGEKHTVHEQLIKYLIYFLKSVDNGVEDRFYRHVWFFFRLIAKSVALNCEVGTPRSQRFEAGFYEDCHRLYLLVTNALVELASEHPAQAMRMNVSLALFVTNLLSTADRGPCFKLIQAYLNHIDECQDPSGRLAQCKFEYLRIICGYEHYVALNLPFVKSEMDQALTPLTDDFRQRHFLAYCIMSHVEKALQGNNKFLRGEALACFRNLLASHDTDPRFKTPAHKSRVASLYFPFVVMVLTMRSRLRPDVDPSQAFEPREKQDIFACFLWILKNFNHRVLQRHWREDGVPADLLVVLEYALDVFQYRGRKETVNTMLASRSQQAVRSLADLYSHDAARFSTLPGGSMSVSRASKLLSTASRTSFNLGERAPTPASNRDSTPTPLQRQSTMPGRLTTAEMEERVMLQAHLAAESMFVVIELLEIIFGYERAMSASGGINENFSRAFGLLLRMLMLNPPDRLVPSLFSLIVRVITYYKRTVFNSSLSYCQKLCDQILINCNSNLQMLRYHATVLLYVMLVHGLNTMNHVLMMSISGLSADTPGSWLRQALLDVKKISSLNEVQPQVNFQRDVEDLLQRAHTVLESTAHMAAHQDDPEMYLDHHSKIADSYAGSPQLRVSFLHRMAKEHVKMEQWSEAAMCVIHCAALTAEVIKGNSKYFSDGAACFVNISKNTMLEKSMVEGARIENLLQISAFSDASVAHQVRVAIHLFKRASRFELVSLAYRHLLPIMEDGKRYEDLAKAAQDMLTCYTKVAELLKNNKRTLGTYYRVLFLGADFAHMRQREFIYKEPNVTGLSIIRARLEALYQMKVKKLVVIDDSRDTSHMQLEDGVSYIQITHVQPYFEDESVVRSHFEQHHEIREFVYTTPFTKSGKARSDNVKEQWLRKTVVVLERGLSFPSIRKRLPVEPNSRKIELNPLQKAIEEMQEKNRVLRSVIHADKLDSKLLQMQLSGTITTQVNAGPLEYARAFLNLEEKTGDSSTEKRNKDRLCYEFEQMVDLLEEGVVQFDKIKADEQQELYNTYRDHLAQLKKNFGKFVPAIRKQQSSGRRSLRKAYSFLSRGQGLNLTAAGSAGPAEATEQPPAPVNETELNTFADLIPDGWTL
ncbi:uncharacterized protein MONBRDRAFT_28379 [Monosiga brevicollis MX1]|uniref:Uncharacterized protein n=1 Tax=Monosiga brevicollis TaxID=81824 RepID=A9V803_MONBE|nr:uncharacterized protein MONBRDRAFT_28379 [Monosiga brevicollis MX1]EDQ86394.1 predicted protein [Monosiga brevicollis MX1]|eukprot:XP_001748784.1 hypothetical protein [Monosiga brevicollis MX1]